MEQEIRCCGRLKEELDSFGGEVQQIFVDSSVAVIGRVRELADSAFDDLKGLVDAASDKVKASGEKAADYVRRNPWKAAVAFVLFSVAVTALTERKKE